MDIPAATQEALPPFLFPKGCAYRTDTPCLFPQRNLFCSPRVRLPRGYTLLVPQGNFFRTDTPCLFPRGTFFVPTGVRLPHGHTLLVPPEEPFLFPQGCAYRTGTPCLFPQGNLFCFHRGTFPARVHSCPRVSKHGHEWYADLLARGRAMLPGKRQTAKLSVLLPINESTANWYISRANGVTCELHCRKSYTVQPPEPMGCGRWPSNCLLFN